MYYYPFHQPTKHLLSPAEIYDTLFRENKLLENGLVFRCFLPRPYWERRGMVALFEHPAIYYEGLPETEEVLKLPAVSTEELRSAFNPVRIATVLSKKDGRKLAFYLEYAFGMIWNKKENPFLNKEFLLEVIVRRFNSINHGEKSDITSKYIMPMKTLLAGILRFPNKIDKVSPVLGKIQNSFFYHYEVLQLIFLMEFFKNQFGTDKDALSLKIIHFYNSMLSCQSISLKSNEKKGFSNNFISISEQIKQDIKQINRLFETKKSLKNLIYGNPKKG